MSIPCYLVSLYGLHILVYNHYLLLLQLFEHIYLALCILRKGLAPIFLHILCTQLRHLLYIVVCPLNMNRRNFLCIRVLQILILIYIQHCLLCFLLLLQFLLFHHLYLPLYIPHILHTYRILFLRHILLLRLLLLFLLLYFP